MLFRQGHFEFSLIDSAAGLQQCIDEVYSSKWLAVDLEFYWRHSYYPQLCLLQLANSEKSFVIDTLEESINQQLPELLKKLSHHPFLVFHSGRQDWRIFEQHCATIPKNVIDIQYSGVYYDLSELQPSLSKLSERLLDYKKCTGKQCSDWRQRPLDKDQKDYAKSDVECIALIYQRILKDLNVQQLNALQQDSEDSRLMCLKGLQKNSIRTSGQKIFGYNELSQRKKFVLQELVAWRDKKAQKKNIPVRWVCSNDVLFSLAKTNVSAREKVVLRLQNQSVNKKVLSQAVELCERIDRVQEEEIEKKLCRNVGSRRVTLDPKKQRKFQQIQDKLETLCAEKGIPVESVVGKKNVINFMLNPNENILSRGWRYYLVGEKLLQWYHKNMLQP